MTNSAEIPLARLTASIFEELAFLLPTPELTPVQQAAPEDGAAEVAFRGPGKGCVEVRLFGGVMPVLAANMLGVESADARLQRDALGELANVLCGNVVPWLAGPEVSYRLSAPVPAGRRSGEALARTVLGVEDGRVEVTLFVEPGEVAT